MIVTEKDALTKWCPFVRVVSVVDNEVAIPACNRVGVTSSAADSAEVRLSASCCIGSKCMAWVATEPDMIRDMPITRLLEPLSLRTQNSVKNMLRDPSLTGPANSVIYFDNMEDAALLVEPNFGRKSLRELRDAIAAYKAASKCEMTNKGYCGLVGGR